MVKLRKKYSGVGLYGKIPARGDFLSSGLPLSFVDAAESWIRGGLMALRNESEWRTAYLSAPIWHFSCAAGVWNETPWSGIFMPSVDQVGRYFPLVIVKPVSEMSNTLFFKLQTGAQQALNPKLADLDAWKRQFSGLEEEERVSRYNGLMSPAIGGVFRALDAEGGLIMEHVVNRLGVELFRQMVMPNTVTAEAG